MNVAAIAISLSLLPAGTAAAPVPGTVAVTLPEQAAADRPFADAVRAALEELSFTSLPQPDHGRYIAEVRVARERRGTVLSRVPGERPSASVGGWGGAVRVPFGTGKTQLADLTIVTLSVRLIARADHRTVWSGSAVAAEVDRRDTAGRLAHAALASFPETVNATASVP